MPCGIVSNGEKLFLGEITARFKTNVATLNLAEEMKKTRATKTHHLGREV